MTELLWIYCDLLAMILVDFLFNLKITHLSNIGANIEISYLSAKVRFVLAR